MSDHPDPVEEASADRARRAIERVLLSEGVSTADADHLIQEWVRTGNYLADAWRLPPAQFVVGNPPYIRLEDVPSAEATAYRAAYPTMRGRADLYVAFFEAALRQLAPDSVYAFICADRWMLNQYGSDLRRLVTGSYAVETVVEMHRADAFETEVDAYPAITVIRRATQGPAVVASAGPGMALVAPATLKDAFDSIRAGGRRDVPTGVRAARVQSWFSGDDPWPRVSPDRLALLKRLEADFDALESVETGARVGIGVATGLDEVFITTDADLVEPSRLLPLAMASDTFSGTLRWSGRYLVDPWEQTGLVNLSKYPRLAAYLETHRDRIAGRNVARRNPAQWFRTIDRVNHSLVSEPKLFLPDIKGRNHPVLDPGTTYPHHNLYVVRPGAWDIEVLGGLLLSAVAQFVIECYAVRMRGGYLRFQAQYRRRIRVPHPRDITPDQAAALRHAFRSRDEPVATRTALAIYGIDGIPDEPDHA